MSSEEVVTLTQVRPSTEDRVSAIVSFSRGGTYQVDLTAPTDEVLGGLNEAFLHDGVTTEAIRALAGDVFDRDLREVFPFSEPDKAEEAKEGLHQLRTDWDRALRSSPNLVLVVEGRERLHRIPWELVAARPYGRLSEQSPIIRKLTGYAPPPDPPADEPLRILLVVARPYGPIDVSHRRVADALLRAGLDRQHWPIVDVLRGGGAYKQLVRRLAEKHYQVVHFDMHGVQDRDGGFLEFESDAVGESDVKVRVGASEVADLLREHQVQLALFTSCESALPSSSDGSHSRSLAHEVAREGVPAAIGMSQPISAEGAKMFAVLLYEALFDSPETPIATALAHAKTAFQAKLQDKGSRRSEEWRLPALFLRSDPLFTIHHSGLEHSIEVAEKPDYVAREHRDFDHRLVDRLLFVNDRPVLIRGLRHTGKRAFLQDLQTWWELAQFATQHAAVDCARSVGLVAQKLAWQLGCEEKVDADGLLAWLDGYLDGDEPGKQVVFYLAAVDRVSAKERALIDALGERATHPAVHVVMSARAKPAWLSCRVQEFDMLWLNTQAAREMFVEIAGRPDDLLIAACSDLPGVVKELASKIHDWPALERPPSESYYDDVLPDADTVVEELTSVGLQLADIIPFAGIKGFPLPIIERDLLSQYLRECSWQGLDIAGPDPLIDGVQQLGYLSPISVLSGRECLRLHPYLTLLARKALREKLELGREMTELTESQSAEMSPYTNAYAAMTEIRQRRFSVLRSGRRVEHWYLRTSSVQYAVAASDDND